MSGVSLLPAVKTGGLNEDVLSLAAAPGVRRFLDAHGLGRQPGVSLADDARMRAGRADRWDAVASAAEADRDTYKRLLRGLAGAAGTPRGPGFERSVDAASRHIARLAPYAMTQAPDLWDRLHGTSGSAAGLAHSLQRAHPDRSPLHNSAIAQDVFRRLYRSGGADQTAGFSAGDVGKMYEHMYDRGMLGPNHGDPAGVADKLRAVSGAVSAVQGATMKYAGLDAPAPTPLSPPPTPLHEIMRSLGMEHYQAPPPFFKRPPKKPALLQAVTAPAPAPPPAVAAPRRHLG